MTTVAALRTNDVAYWPSRAGADRVQAAGAPRSGVEEPGRGRARRDDLQGDGEYLLLATTFLTGSRIEVMNDR